MQRSPLSFFFRRDFSLDKDAWLYYLITRISSPLETLSRFSAVGALARNLEVVAPNARGIEFSSRFRFKTLLHFTCPPRRVRLLTDAISNIYENRADLLSVSAQ